MADEPPAKARRAASTTYEVLPADGDCLYAAVVRAVAGHRRGPHSVATVRELRGLLADHLTEAHFEALQTAFACSAREYAFMRRCKTLGALRDLQRLCGADVGSRLCVWGDWLQLQLAADLLRLVVRRRETRQGPPSQRAHQQWAPRCSCATRHRVSTCWWCLHYATRRPRTRRSYSCTLCAWTRHGRVFVAPFPTTPHTG